MRFLLIDRILTCEPGRRLVAVKNVTLESDYLDHHFPGLPVMPGVLVTEALAQASGWLLRKTAAAENGAVLLPLLAGIKGSRFMRMVQPGDSMELEAVIKSRECNMAITTTTARVGGKVVARAELLMAMREYRDEVELAQAVSEAAILERILDRPAEPFAWMGA